MELSGEVEVCGGTRTRADDRSVITHIPYTPLPIDQTDVRYALGPDSLPRAGVAAGQTDALRGAAPGSEAALRGSLADGLSFDCRRLIQASQARFPG